MGERPHTPGPWVLAPEGDHGHLTLIRASHATQGMRVATTWITGRAERNEANARLIASAPDLLEAAQKALSIADSWVRDQLEGTSRFNAAMAELDPIRAAITRATTPPTEGGDR